MSVRDSLIFTGLIFALFGFFLFIALEDRGLVHLLDQSRTLAKVQAANTRLEDENSELCRSIGRLKSDMGYVESMARRDLGMVGKEEVVLRFKKDAPGSTPGEAFSPPAPAGSAPSP
ncbi:MAG: septum formation initiator family protein [Pseudomonadota bacterium]